MDVCCSGDDDNSNPIEEVRLDPGDVPPVMKFGTEVSDFLGWWAW